MPAFIIYIADFVKRSAANIPMKPPLNAVNTEKNSQGFGLSPGNAGFSTAEAKNNSEQPTSNNSQEQPAAVGNPAIARCKRLWCDPGPQQRCSQSVRYD
jgi:hypothetical protein